MITNPFNSETFQEKMKPLTSMAYRSLEYENVESSIVKVCAEMSDKLGSATYESICSDKAPSTVKAEALDYLQRAILHFTIYHHIIYLIANVSNDGVTVTKSDDKTTIYKYQQDQLEEQLVADAWFWLNRLIMYLNDHLKDFPEWASSTEHTQLSDLPVTVSDFERYTGVSDPTFLLYAGWIVREVYRECILSCQAADASLSEVQKQALCYDVMARACRRLAFHALPAPIRIDINNEMGKNHAAQADTTVREKVAEIFAVKAKAYWESAEAEISKTAEGETAVYGQARRLSENDKFAV